MCVNTDHLTPLQANESNWLTLSSLLWTGAHPPAEAVEKDLKMSAPCLLPMWF